LDFITYMERYTREHSAHSAEELNTIVTWTSLSSRCVIVTKIANLDTQFVHQKIK
jgi:hypothetical protein